MEDLYLIYIHPIGLNHKGFDMFEFIFSDTLEDIDGEDWDSAPAAGNPRPPVEHIKKVGRLTTNEITMDFIQDSDTFAVWDAIDGIVALAWQNIDDYDEYPEHRLVFRFGDKIEHVEENLYGEYDLRLEYKETNEQIR